LLDAKNEKKISETTLIRVAYQCPLSILFIDGKEKEEAIPYTFEDALVLSNIPLFKNMTKSTGLIKKMSLALSKATLTESTQEMFDALGDGKKAEMALELLFQKEPKDLAPPKYIVEGLDWLSEKLKNKDRDFFDMDCSKSGGEK
jgi:hypothetical protein